MAKLAHKYKAVKGLVKIARIWLAHAQKLIVLWAGMNATAVVKHNQEK